LIKNFEEAQITINSLQQDLAETKNKEVQNIDEYKEQVEMASRDMAERIKILEQNVKQKDEIVIYFFEKEYNFYFSIKQQRDLLKRKKQ